MIRSIDRVPAVNQSTLEKVVGLTTPESVMSLATDLIRIPSPTENEKAVAEYVFSQFQRHGFEVFYQEVSPGRPQVIGRLRGSGGGRSLMLNGHLDNDSLTESWAWNPYEPRIEGNHLWGAGIHNMKSGVAAMLAAAFALKRAAIDLKGDLIVACVVGELQGGKGTIHLLKSGITADMAIVPEPYSTNVIITKCVGVHKCAISTVGRSIHTSRSEYGVDAINLMLEVIKALPRLDLRNTDPDFPGLPKINVASIIGGRSREYDLAGPSNLSDYCTIIIDVRYGGDWSPSDIDGQFIKFLNQVEREIPNFKYEYHHPPPAQFKVGGADMPPTDVSVEEEIVQILKASHQAVTGRSIEQCGVVLPYSYCGNDTAHIQRAGIPCCLYGPRGDEDDVEKHVRIDEMIECAKTLAAAGLRVCGT
jgi:acetylornithine deacetylase